MNDNTKTVNSFVIVTNKLCYNEFLNKHAAKHADYYNKKVITLLYLIVFSVCTIEIEHKGLSVPFVFIYYCQYYTDIVSENVIIRNSVEEFVSLVYFKYKINSKELNLFNC